MTVLAQPCRHLYCPGPMRSYWRNLFLTTVALPALVSTGCVERTLQIQSEPAGALVHLNGEEVGRTPMRKSFLWYGTYDVEVRKEGYVTRTAETKVWAPWWQIPPFDLFAEILPLPLRDHHSITYRLSQSTEQHTDPALVIGRAVELRGQLQGSRNTRGPRSSTKLTTAPSTPPTTQEAE